MKKSLFIICLSALCSSAAAQDLILKKNADEIEAKVVKVTDSYIEYKKWSNLDGPSYEIPAKDVFLIKYQNGTRDVISTSDSQGFDRTATVQTKPRYQGEFAFAYGLGVGEASDYLPTNRLVFETVHGVRINQYAFVGLGLAVNYFYKELELYYGYGGYYSESSGIVLPIFLNAKGYLPVTPKFSVYASLDLGAAMGISGYTDGGTEFYTSFGPGINFGKAQGVRGDFSIRFQHMGTGMNAILFRVGVNF